MLDWLIRHAPDHAAGVIGDIVGEAARRFQIPRHVTERSLRTALALDGKLDDGGYTEFLDRAPAPASPRKTRGPCWKRTTGTPRHWRSTSTAALPLVGLYVQGRRVRPRQVLSA